MTLAGAGVLNAGFGLLFEERSVKTPARLLMACMLALPVAAHAEPASHEHGASAQYNIELNAGRKWPTDAALRKGMAAIRTLAGTALPAAHRGKYTPAQYEALANGVNAQLTYIVQNCKLDPRADAQLHIVLANIAKGVETVQGKHSSEARSSGVVEIVQAMNTYGMYFNHAGWKPIELPH